jgi:hypothetical protein
MTSNPQEFPQAELIELGAGHLNAAAETIKQEFPKLRESPIFADYT